MRPDYQDGMPLSDRLIYKKTVYLFALQEDQVKSSQVKFRLLHERKIRKIGEASADTTATETYYIKGCYNLEETIKTQKY